MPLEDREWKTSFLNVLPNVPDTTTTTTITPKSPLNTKFLVDNKSKIADFDNTIQKVQQPKISTSATATATPKKGLITQYLDETDPAAIGVPGSAKPPWFGDKEAP